MLHTDAKSLRDQADRLFSQKQPWDTRNQDIADQFYPERADFTVSHSIGEEFAEHLMTGYPSLVRRDLGNSIGSMLRPRGQPWFHMAADREEKETHDAKAWLEWATGTMRRAMYDRRTMLTRATKEGDHDFASFGGCAISTEVNRHETALLYRCWHLRDMAWSEDSYGQLCFIPRNWRPTIRELCGYFGDKCHPKVKEKLTKDPNAKVQVRHMVIKTSDYDAGKRFRQPWTSLFVDCDNNHIMEERGSWTKIYTIPRWATVSGSQYPYSPAVTTALPDARLLQSMTLTLLEAGERAANPPMIGVSEAVRGDLNIYAGGFTAIDAEYDERLGEVLRPLVHDKNGLPYGMEMADRQQQMIREAFYLNTLNMPERGGPEMTAFEVGQRVQEYIRNALPLFEPMEDDYNGALCEITFETLMREGAFGSPDTIPPEIAGSEINWRFESPLAEMLEKQKGQQFLEAKAMIAEATAMDPDAPMVMNFGEALRDVLGGIGSPTKWLNSPEEVVAMKGQRQQQQETDEMLASMEQSAGIAEKLGNAAQNFDGAM